MRKLGIELLSLRWRASPGCMAWALDASVLAGARGDAAQACPARMRTAQVQCRRHRTAQGRPHSPSLRMHSRSVQHCLPKLHPLTLVQQTQAQAVAQLCNETPQSFLHCCWTASATPGPGVRRCQYGQMHQCRLWAPTPWPGPQPRTQCSACAARQRSLSAQTGPGSGGSASRRSPSAPCWGTAGHVAVAGLADDDTHVVVCSKGSAPYRLELLHRRGPAHGLAISMCFDPNGLLLFWAAYERPRLGDTRRPGFDVGAGPVCVSVCRLASAEGTGRVISTMHSPASCCNRRGRRLGASVSVWWSAEGDGLLILGPPQDTGHCLA